MYIGLWCLSPLQSKHLGTWPVLPVTISCSIIFSWISSTVWNLFPFKGDFSFGKSQKSQGAISRLQGADSPGWFDVSPKNSAQEVIHERAHCCNEAANHQLPIAMALWIIQIVPVEECSSLMQNMIQIHCSTHSVILNAVATQYTCSLNSVYHPHWLVQWSRHCSCVCIPVLSPWLPGYTDGAQTIIVTLTMAGRCLDRPCTLVQLHLWH